MSRTRHEGVTCDVCNAHNFTGKRYKCLICFDYDLCVRCYEGGLASADHSADHPAQCILTKAEFETHFAGENLPYQRAQSFTCPLCGLMGFTLSRLREHVLSEHGRSHREVLCPVCASSAGYSAGNSLTSSLGPHLHTEHASTGQQTGAEERFASMRRHLPPPHPDSGGGNPSSSGNRRRTGCTNASAEYSRGNTDVLRATWLQSAAAGSARGAGGGNAQAPSSSSAVTSTPTEWSAIADPDLTDYSEFLSLHDSFVHGSQADRLRERLAAEAGRHGSDPNSPLYRYLAHPRFAGSGLRAAAAAAASQPGGGGGGQSSQAAPSSTSAGTSTASQQRAGAQFPTNHWECLMNTPAPPREFVLPCVLDDDSLLAGVEGEAADSAGTRLDRADFAGELLLSMLDVRLDSNLLEHLESLSSESDPEQSVETDV